MNMYRPAGTHPRRGIRLHPDPTYEMRTQPEQKHIFVVQQLAGALSC